MITVKAGLEAISGAILISLCQLRNVASVLHQYKSFNKLRRWREDLMGHIEEKAFFWDQAKNAERREWLGACLDTSTPEQYDVTQKVMLGLQ